MNLQGRQDIRDENFQILFLQHYTQNGTDVGVVYHLLKEGKVSVKPVEEERV